MSKHFKKAGRQALSVFLSATTVLWLSGFAALVPVSAGAAALTQAQVDSIIGLLQSFGADATTIANVQASLTGGTPTTGGGTGSGSTAACTFTRDLTIGSTGNDVMCLQKYLNGKGFTVSATGAGSAGQESTYFGSKTQSAVAKWQAANNITPSAGYFGAKSRAAFAAMGGGTTTPGTTPPPVSVGTGLTVTAASQPQASLAPQSAARIPFTRVTFTASADGDVTVNGLTVERTGLANDAVFAGVVLLDESGVQVGLAKTLNSNHQTVLTEPFVVKAGQSRTMTIAGNMASSLSSYAGQVAFLSLVGVNTSATVNGALPITGAGHTINASLSIGTATLLLGSLDPNNSAASKEVGTTGYTFSSIRVTAGSAEKIHLNSVRWNQSGSVGSGDLANLKAYVEGVAYPLVVSSDGKYFTANLGGKILDKGEGAEISIKGDIVSGSGRTIKFDLYKNTDLNISGDTYGYGITPTGSDTGFTGSVFFTNSQVTVANGSMTISKGTSVAAQNIAVNLSNEPLGGFQVEVKGEPISVANTIFYVSGVNPTSVSLFDPAGNVVAGPVDASGHTVTFTDTITYPIGTGTYTLKGKVPSGTAANTSVTASTTSSVWTSVTGQQTGNSITPSGGTVTANTMTVKTAVIAISVSSSPVAQTIVPGGVAVNFANYLFDATGSGEDVKFSTIPLAYNAYAGTATNLTNCKIKDSNGNDLTTGSNTVNPSAAASSTTFTFDNQLTVAKGGVTTIGLYCNVAGGASGAYAWGVDSSATFTGTGKTSGQSATVTATDANGPKMTLASGGAGTLTVIEDTAASLTARLAYAGQTNVKLAQLKFHAANEAINLTNLALQLTNTASSSASDFVGNQLKLWKSDGVTQVGTITLNSSTGYGTTTSITGFQIPKDGDAVMIVTADLNAIGVSQPGTEGHIVSVDYDGDDSSGTKGVGVSSGSTISTSSTSDTAVASVTVYKTVPTIVESTTSATLVGGATLYKFSVTANPGSANGIYLYKVSFQVTTSSGLLVDSYRVKGPNGNVNATSITHASITSGLVEIVFDATAADRFVGAGQTKNYELIADTVTPSGSGTDTFTVKMLGDTARPVNDEGTFVSDAAAQDADANDDFIWSPQATTTVTIGSQDFTNGYAVPVGTGTETLTNDLPVRSFTFTN